MSFPPLLLFPLFPTPAAGATFYGVRIEIPNPEVGIAKAAQDALAAGHVHACDFRLDFCGRSFEVSFRLLAEALAPYEVEKQPTNGEGV
jgi:hypothetical protein